MPATPASPIGAAETQDETRLEFPDNRLLPELTGAYGAHLTQVEQALAVQIVQRGNELVILGEDGSRARAAEALRALYARAEDGRGVEPALVEAELRMSRGLGPADQMELLPRGPTEIRTRKKTVEPRTEAQRAYVEALHAHEMAFGIGPAGTGKTYLAVAVGVSMFIGGHVDRIVLSRPAVEAGERLGFLPGDMKDKVDPYMQPLYDALADFLPAKQTQSLMAEKRIEIAPLAFMRGRTLSNAFVVLDEAQNATSMQMKMFLTRLGEGSRMVITGDRSQIDLPRGVTSGLHDAERILKRRAGDLVQLLHVARRRAPPARRRHHRGLRRRCLRPDGEAEGGPDGPVEAVIEEPRWEAAGLAAIAGAAAGAALRHLGRDPAAFEIAVLGCDDARIAALNAAFRGRDAPPTCSPGPRRRATRPTRRGPAPWATWRCPSTPARRRRRRRASGWRITPRIWSCTPSCTSSGTITARRREPP